MNTCITKLIKGCWILLLVLLFSLIVLFTISLATFSSDVLPQIRVISLNVSSFNVSNSHITSNWNISFTMKNNHLLRTYTYYSVEVSVFYKSNVLSQASIDGFRIRPKHHQLLNATVVASLQNIDNSVADAIVADKAHGVVDFNLVLHCEWYRTIGIVGAHRIRLKTADASCKDIQVGFSNLTGNTGAMGGGSRRCKVHY